MPFLRSPGFGVGEPSRQLPYLFVGGAFAQPAPGRAEGSAKGRAQKGLPYRMVLCANGAYKKLVFSPIRQR
ncbi:MAG: hypothetical protein LBN96_02315 [Desulfovibrio sp.]|jgi:hypothetical protein|nr:hypothetical protein [Desulfovibrio sp.]